MHVYAFGSVCRGEIDRGSDLDLLAAVSDSDPRFDPAIYSIYSYERLAELWREGNPFAWHLTLESKLLFAADGIDFIASLANPAAYVSCAEDCQKFRALFHDAVTGLTESPRSAVFELSTAFLAIRNIATCYSLGLGDTPVFGRHAALRLGSRSLRLDERVYSTLASARILSTRATGPRPSPEDIVAVCSHLPYVATWMDELVAEARNHV